MSGNKDRRRSIAPDAGRSKLSANNGGDELPKASLLAVPQADALPWSAPKRQKSDSDASPALTSAKEESLLLSMLPTDALIHILEFCGDYASIIRLSTVNKSFYLLSSSNVLWYDFARKSWGAVLQLRERTHPVPAFSWKRIFAKYYQFLSTNKALGEYTYKPPSPWLYIAQLVNNTAVVGTCSDETDSLMIWDTPQIVKGQNVATPAEGDQFTLADLSETLYGDDWRLQNVVLRGIQSLCSVADNLNTAADTVAPFIKRVIEILKNSFELRLSDPSSAPAAALMEGASSTLTQLILLCSPQMGDDLNQVVDISADILRRAPGVVDSSLLWTFENIGMVSARRGPNPVLDTKFVLMTQAIDEVLQRPNTNSDYHLLSSCFLALASLIDGVSLDEEKNRKKIQLYAQQLVAQISDTIATTPETDAQLSEKFVFQATRCSVAQLAMLKVAGAAEDMAKWISVLFGILNESSSYNPETVTQLLTKSGLTYMDPQAEAVRCLSALCPTHSNIIEPSLTRLIPILISFFEPVLEERCAAALDLVRDIFTYAQGDLTLFNASLKAPLQTIWPKAKATEKPLLEVASTYLPPLGDILTMFGAPAFDIVLGIIDEVDTHLRTTTLKVKEKEDRQASVVLTQALQALGIIFHSWRLTESATVPTTALKRLEKLIELVRTNQTSGDIRVSLLCASMQSMSDAIQNCHKEAEPLLGSCTDLILSCRQNGDAELKHCAIEVVKTMESEGFAIDPLLESVRLETPDDAAMGEGEFLF